MIPSPDHRGINESLQRVQESVDHVAEVTERSGVVADDEDAHVPFRHSPSSILPSTSSSSLWADEAAGTASVDGGDFADARRRREVVKAKLNDRVKAKAERGNDLGRVYEVIGNNAAIARSVQAVDS